MKKIFMGFVFICSCLLSVCLLLPQHAYADPPKDIVLNYNIKTQILTVAITHKSSFTGFHYVKQVEIKKSNEPAGKNDYYTSQPGKVNFVYTYNVPAAVNDILEVTASCNIQGKKTVTLKIEQEKD
ncbi:MAG: hypothetical protein FD159_2481 [Syntrophaceae bacterium]|nr:MAG: hypothetical protein FD159_2481 [Syntrophaceae bacterium]